MTTAPTTTMCNSTDPESFLHSILRDDHRMSIPTTPSLSLDNFFFSPTDASIAGYETNLIAAVRANDIATMRNDYLRQNKTLDCCNRFGESILHTACRRGATDMVRFLVEEAGVNVRVRDDYGRTALHDAFWTREPETALVTILLRACPDLLYLTDKRGFTPLAYVRKNHHAVWCTYLDEHRDIVVPTSGLWEKSRGTGMKDNNGKNNSNGSIADTSVVVVG